MTRDILTVREAADYLRISEDTVRRLLRAGRLPGRKVGLRQWRIRRVDLDEFLGPLPSWGGPAAIGQTEATSI